MRGAAEDSNLSPSATPRPQSTSAVTHTLTSLVARAYDKGQVRDGPPISGGQRIGNIRNRQAARQGRTTGLCCRSRHRRITCLTISILLSFNTHQPSLRDQERYSLVNLVQITQAPRLLPSIKPRSLAYFWGPSFSLLWALPGAGWGTQQRPTASCLQPARSNTPR